MRLRMYVTRCQYVPASEVGERLHNCIGSRVSVSIEGIGLISIVIITCVLFSFSLRVMQQAAMLSALTSIDPTVLFLPHFLPRWPAAKQEKHNPVFAISWFRFATEFLFNSGQTQGGWSTLQFATLNFLTFLFVSRPWSRRHPPSLWYCLTTSPVSSLASSMIQTRLSIHWTSLL